MKAHPSWSACQYSMPFYWWIIFICICMPSFIYFSVGRHWLGLIPLLLLWIMAAWTNIHAHFFFAWICLRAFEFACGREVAWSFCVDSLRNCQAIFHSPKVHCYICHGTCHLLLVLHLFPVGRGPPIMSNTKGTDHNPHLYVLFML